VKTPQGPQDLILSDVAPLAHPVLGVLEEVADDQAEVRFNRKEHSYDPAPPGGVYDWMGPRARVRPRSPHTFILLFDELFIINLIITGCGICPHDMDRLA